MLRTADLLIVMGTSLTVHPFASLTQIVAEDCPRMLINMERAGDIGSWLDDVVALGDCDSVVRELCEELGWGDELEQLWGETAGMGEQVETKEEIGRDESLVREVEELVVELEKALKVSDEHKERVEREMALEKQEQNLKEDKEDKVDGKGGAEVQVETAASSLPVPQVLPKV